MLNRMTERSEETQLETAANVEQSSPEHEVEEDRREA